MIKRYDNFDINEASATAIDKIDKIDKIIELTKQKLETLEELKNSILEEDADIIIDTIIINYHTFYLAVEKDTNKQITKGTLKYVQKFLKKPEYDNKKVFIRPKKN